MVNDRPDLTSSGRENPNGLILNTGPITPKTKVNLNKLAKEKVKKKKIEGIHFAWQHPDYHSSGQIAFEYQSAVGDPKFPGQQGRDGFEPDPYRPMSEYFGPFRIDYESHTIFLQDWNLVLMSDFGQKGMGNLVVGLAHDYSQASNSVVLGGGNTVEGKYAVAAGLENTAKGTGAVCAGGAQNSALKNFAAVFGGSKNKADAEFSTVAAGVGGLAGAKFSSVLGGQSNKAMGWGTTILAGSLNVAFGNLSTISGGYNNTVPEENLTASVQGGKNTGWNTDIKPPFVKPEKGTIPDDERDVECNEVGGMPNHPCRQRDNSPGSH